MKLQPAKSDINMVCRLVSDDNTIEMGIYPVLFGYRVVAAYVGDVGPAVNWCCGDSYVAVDTAYNFLKFLIEKNGTLTGLLPASDIKPYQHDQYFMNWLTSQIGEAEFEHVLLPSLNTIRKEYMDLMKIFRGKNI